MIADDEERRCRYCFEGEGDSPELELISPCQCRGHLLYTHRACLTRWQRRQGARHGGVRGVQDRVDSPSRRVRPRALPAQRQNKPEISANRCGDVRRGTSSSAHRVDDAGLFNPANTCSCSDCARPTQPATWRLERTKPACALYAHAVPSSHEALAPRHLFNPLAWQGRRDRSIRLDRRRQSSAPRDARGSARRRGGQRRTQAAPRRHGAECAASLNRRPVPPDAADLSGGAAGGAHLFTDAWRFIARSEWRSCGGSRGAGTRGEQRHGGRRRGAAATEEEEDQRASPTPPPQQERTVVATEPAVAAALVQSHPGTRVVIVQGCAVWSTAQLLSEVSRHKWGLAAARGSDIPFGGGPPAVERVEEEGGTPAPGPPPELWEACWRERSPTATAGIPPSEGRPV